MSKQQQVSARETYVLDDDVLAELEDVSLTGVMRDLTSTMKQALPQDVPTEDGDDLDLGFLDDAKW